jgi:hypothetical protein
MKFKKTVDNRKTSIRSKNRALLWILLGVCLLFYGIAMVRIQGA